ncbi:MULTISPECIES: cysteine-rich small domain-containing protein [Sulfurospirillum]|uniref:Cysteine-rich domain protein n=4 Tax=Sulfurospirillum TaxID=57665 RepID=A0A1Y0HL12_9BACT|nr:MULTISPECIES: cysteine-rich small domain-containing protein [Sulfurospirillum]AHJ12808.1 cysteine-rich domain protein [Sulfurospirillum multivorans DSM 12446]AOO65287.1 cysteine-rich domain protein [Sulfurospirillum halorespirans DSM 13726]ARU48768.1 cysteine-rich domain protein [Sulfurospirillum diekertiae]ASC93590.1 cysteine-rich domain protein [Sulfurospirillum diekertiae]ATB69634.1 cysteine-rich domain protein [Sulfurospirillum diekertiae]
MSYKFVQNKACEYFPCHKIEEDTTFNCLFCYCPLYALGEQCGGKFTYTKNGIKSCVECDVVHHKDTGYEYVQAKMHYIIKLAVQK